MFKTNFDRRNDVIAWQWLAIRHEIRKQNMLLASECIGGGKQLHRRLYVMYCVSDSLVSRLRERQFGEGGDINIWLIACVECWYFELLTVASAACDGFWYTLDDVSTYKTSGFKLHTVTHGGRRRKKTTEYMYVVEKFRQFVNSKCC